MWTLCFRFTSSKERIDGAAGTIPSISEGFGAAAFVNHVVS